MDIFKHVLCSGCRDLDECSEGGKNCGKNTDCINTDGSHHCVCQIGFEGDPCEILWPHLANSTTLFSPAFFFSPRQWMYRHRRVSTLQWFSWECKLYLLVPHIPEPSWRCMDHELLCAAAMPSCRCLHQPVLQGWARIQVCSCWSDFCCCGYRRPSLECWSWCSESWPQPLWRNDSKMAS